MKERWIVAIFIAISILLFISTIRGLEGNPTPSAVAGELQQAAKPFELSPERGRYLLILSIAENGSFALDKELGDAAAPDVGYYKGKFYIYFPPGISLLLIPSYFLGKLFNHAQLFTFFTISLFALGALFFVYKISREILKLPLWASLAGALIFAFGTTSWSYAVTISQHHVSTFLILSTYYCVWKYRQITTRKQWNYALYPWIAFGISVWVDYPNVLMMGPVMVYFFLSSLQIEKKADEIVANLRPAFFITSLFFIGLIVLHGYYNYVHFGAWNRVSGGITGFKELQTAQKKYSDQASIEAEIQRMQAKKSPVGFFREDNVAKSFFTLLVAEDKGLFLFSPIMILGVFGIIISLAMMNFEIGTLIALFGANLFLYSSWGDPWGGWAYGPRYLIPTMAYFSIFSALWLTKIRYQLAGRILAFVLFAYSAAIGLLGALTTSQLPPKVEADFLKMQYNFILNIEHYLFKDRSSSYVYNKWFTGDLTLLQYFFALYFMLITLAYIILFVLPFMEHHIKRFKKAIGHAHI